MEQKTATDYADIQREINDSIEVLSRSVTTTDRSKALDEDGQHLAGSPDGALVNPIDVKKIYAQILNDEEIRGFYGIIVDAIVQSGYDVTGPDKEKAKQKLKELQFNKHRKTLYFKLLTELHSFIELIPNKEGNDTVEIKIQPNYSMSPILTKKGMLKGYEKLDVDGKVVKWKVDEMVHLTVENYDGRFWNTPQLVTLERLIMLKNRVMDHIMNKFKKNDFKTHFHLQNASDDEVREIIRSFTISGNNPDKWLVTAGKEELVGKKLDEETSILPLIELLNKIRNMMLTLIRVPPIIAGTVDNSNRSNSDTQAHFVFTMRLRSFLMDFEDSFNNEFFPKLGLDATLTHSNVTMKEDKEWLDMANQLVAMGASKDRTVLWLNERGLELPEDIFQPTEREQVLLDEQQEKEDELMEQKQEKKMPFAPNSNQYPSRKPQKKDTVDYKPNK